MSNVVLKAKTFLVNVAFSNSAFIWSNPKSNMLPGSSHQIV